MWFAPQVCNKTVHLVTPAVLKKLNMSSTNSKLKIVYHCLFRDPWFYFVAMLFHYLHAKFGRGLMLHFLTFSFSLIRSIAQWHKHTIYLFIFFLLMRRSLNHRLLRLIEGRWLPYERSWRTGENEKHTYWKHSKGNFLIKDAGDLSAWQLHNFF